MDSFAKELEDHKKIKMMASNFAKKQLSLTEKRREKNKSTGVIEYQSDEDNSDADLIRKASTMKNNQLK